MYSKKKLALGTAVAYSAVALLVLSTLYMGTVVAYPIAGVGGFTVEANEVTAKNVYIHPGVTPTSSSSSAVSANAEVPVENYQYYQGDYAEQCSWGTCDPGPDVTNGMANFDSANLVKDGFSLDPNFGVGGPGFRERGDNFAIRYTQDIVIEEGGQYTFTLDSDDGSKLYVNDFSTPVVDNGGYHGAGNPVSGTVNLPAGTHDIRIEYFEATSDETLSVSWSGPDTGGTQQTLSGSPLTYDTFTNPTYRYYESGTFERINGGMPSFGRYNREAVGDAPNLDNIGLRERDTNYGFRFQQCLDVPTSGTYNFTTSSDDGSQLFVNQELVVDNGDKHGIITEYGLVELDDGEHSVRVDYFQGVGGQGLDVTWAGPPTGGVQEPIPDSRLSPLPCESTQTSENYPALVLELSQVTFSNLLLTKEIDMSILPGLNGIAQIRLEGGETFDTNQLLFKASALQAQTSTFNGFIARERTNPADARRRLRVATGPGSPAIPTRSLTDLNASAGEDGLTLGTVEIQSHYLAADSVPLASVTLGVQYDTDRDGTYEYQFT